MFSVEPYLYLYNKETLNPLEWSRILCFKRMSCMVMISWFFIKEINNLKILRIFNEYGMVFEKIIRKDKIRLYSSAMILQRASNIHTLLWFNQGRILISYIGCPIFKGKPKQIHFQSIMLKIRTKLVSWKGILLSIKGITQLIKSIIQDMLIYYFPIYLWPTKVLT